MGQYVFTRFYMLLDQKYHLEKYYERRLGSHMWIIVHKQKYSRPNELFSKLSQFWQNERDLCKKITVFGFAAVVSVNLPETKLISSNDYLYNYRWPQIFTTQYIKLTVTGASMIFGCGSTVFVK